MKSIRLVVRAPRSTSSCCIAYFNGVAPTTIASVWRPFTLRTIIRIGAVSGILQPCLIQLLCTVFYHMKQMSRSSNFLFRGCPLSLIFTAAGEALHSELTVSLHCKEHWPGFCTPHQASDGTSFYGRPSCNVEVRITRQQLQS